LCRYFEEFEYHKSSSLSNIRVQRTWRAEHEIQFRGSFNVRLSNKFCPMLAEPLTRGVIFVKRTAQRGVIEIILECNKACVPRIGLRSRNKNWPRGATNFILANKSWPRASMDIILECHKESVCVSNEIRSSTNK